MGSGLLAAWNGAAYHHLLCGLFAGNGIHFRLSSHAVSSCTALFGTAIARAKATIAVRTSFQWQIGSLMGKAFPFLQPLTGISCREPVMHTQSTAICKSIPGES